MCYEVKCSTCGKTTWGGCGRHVPSVHKRVPEGEHCLCRDWPGVKLGDQSSSASTAADSETASVCAIL
ncbi:hypothetical protein AAG906_030448 [Vitis piasezkii]|uniref:Uncharacterized protein n=1 Tax=Vitis vinifera TaxID=29760 RepID=F6H163_VITVI